MDEYDRRGAGPEGHAGCLASRAQQPKGAAALAPPPREAV